MDPPANRKEGSRFTLLLGGISVALAALVILLAVQNRALKNRIASVSVAHPTVKLLQEGESFDSLLLVDDTGNRSELSFGAGRTLLLLFTMSCPACTETLPVWQSLLSEGTPTDVRVVGVQLDRATAASTGGQVLHPAALPFEVYGVDPAASPALARVRSIPATVVLDGSGVVERAWFGLLDGKQQDELRELLFAG